MKIKVISRNPDEYVRETKQDINKSKCWLTLIIILILVTIRFSISITFTFISRSAKLNQNVILNLKCLA